MEKPPPADSLIPDPYNPLSPAIYPTAMFPFRTSADLSDFADCAESLLEPPVIMSRRAVGKK